MEVVREGDVGCSGDGQRGDEEAACDWEGAAFRGWGEVLAVEVQQLEDGGADVGVGGVLADGAGEAGEGE